MIFRLILISICLLSHLQAKVANTLEEQLQTLITPIASSQYEYIERIDIMLLEKAAIDAVIGSRPFKIQLRDDVLYKGTMQIPIIIGESDQEEHRSVPVVIDIWLSCYETAEKIEKNIPLTENHIRQVSRHINSLPLNPIQNKNQLIGKESKTTLSEGVLYAEWMIREIPLIRRGDPVSILISNGNIEMAVRGIALENSNKDLSIEVQSQYQGNYKTFRGKIIGNKDNYEVKVNLVN